MRVEKHKHETLKKVKRPYSESKLELESNLGEISRF